MVFVPSKKHQKKHHYFRATLAKIRTIKINHIWIQICYSSPYETNKPKGFLQTGEKLQWNRKSSFSKITAHWASYMKGFLFRTFNGYSFNFNDGLCKLPTGFRLCRTPSPVDEQFLWWKWPYAISLHFSPFRHKLNCFLTLSVKRNTTSSVRCSLKFTSSNLFQKQISFNTPS